MIANVLVKSAGVEMMRLPTLEIRNKRLAAGYEIIKLTREEKGQGSAETKINKARHGRC